MSSQIKKTWTRSFRVSMHRLKLGIRERRKIDRLLDITSNQIYRYDADLSSIQTIPGSITFKEALNEQEVSEARREHEDISISSIQNSQDHISDSVLYSSQMESIVDSSSLTGSLNASELQESLAQTSKRDITDAEINLTVDEIDAKVSQVESGDSTFLKRIKRDSVIDSECENHSNLVDQPSKSSETCNITHEAKIPENFEQLKTQLEQLKVAFNQLQAILTGPVKSWIENESLLKEQAYSSLVEEKQTLVYEKLAWYEGMVVDLLSEMFSRIEISCLMELMDSLGEKIRIQIDTTKQADTAAMARYEELSGEYKNLTGEHEILKARSNMLEDNIAYLHKQNDTLRASNHYLNQLIGNVSDALSNLKISLGEMFSTQCTIHAIFNQHIENTASILSDASIELSGVKSKLDIFQSILSTVDIKRVKDQVVGFVQDQLHASSNMIESLSENNRTLLAEFNEMKLENIELREKNESLQASDKELREEIEIKEAYSKELERSTDELMKSNKFYEDQLLTADNVMKSLRESKIKNSTELISEIEKLKKAFTKENGLLKLRIEELETELSTRNN